MVGLCSVCSHNDRSTIDSHLLQKDISLRQLESMYGVSRSALARHKDKHLSNSLIKAKGSEAIADSDFLLSQLQDLQARTLKILGAAEKEGNARIALQAVKELREILKVLIDLTTKLQIIAISQSTDRQGFTIAEFGIFASGILPPATGNYAGPHGREFFRKFYEQHGIEAKDQPEEQF